MYTSRITYMYSSTVIEHYLKYALYYTYAYIEYHHYSEVVVLRLSMCLTRYNQIFHLTIRGKWSSGHMEDYIYQTAIINHINNLFTSYLISVLKSFIS